MATVSSATAMDKAVSIPESTATVYVLVADGVWAKLFRSDFPFEDMKLIQHRVNYGSKGRPASRTGVGSKPPADSVMDEDFSRDLCRTLGANYRDGKFKSLILIASPRFLDATRALLDAAGVDRIFTESAASPGQLTEPELSSLVRSALRAN